MIAVREGNSWLLESLGDFGEKQRSRVSLSGKNIARLSAALAGGGLNREEAKLGAAVLHMAHALTRGQGEDFEISDEEGSVYLAGIQS